MTYGKSCYLICAQRSCTYSLQSFAFPHTLRISAPPVTPPFPLTHHSLHDFLYSFFGYRHIRQYSEVSQEHIVKCKSPFLSWTPEPPVSPLRVSWQFLRFSPSFYLPLLSPAVSFFLTHAVFEEIIFSLFLQTDLSVTGDLTGLAYWAWGKTGCRWVDYIPWSHSSPPARV